MNVKETDLVVRVARLAALADPLRLRIVDLLTLSDLAPVELQGRLGVTSSLLAHHLRHLERVGFIVRAQSEADRRRTYLRLRAGALDDLMPSNQVAVRRVVFVCTGNSARSQFAAAMWLAASDVPVASAGTHPAERMEPGAIDAACRHGLCLAGVKPRGLEEVLAADDFIVTVCDKAHEELGCTGRVHWSVPDPVRTGTDSDFEAAYQSIASRVQLLASKLTSA